jgi:hypothetical protein
MNYELRIKSLIKIAKAIVLLVLFQSCNTYSTEKQPIQNEDTLSFMEIISVLPDIKLPYTMWCGIEDGFPVIEN